MKGRYEPTNGVKAASLLQALQALALALAMRPNGQLKPIFYNQKYP